VLPGEAFCDECGASLSAAAPTVIPGVSNDAPTMFAPPPAANAAAPSTGEPTVICAACGQPNLASDRFCDHCGAALTAPAAGLSADADMPTVLPDPVAAPATNGAAPPAAPSDAPAETAMAEAPTAEQPMLSVTSPDAQATYAAERQRLEDEIARQQQVISQLEPVQMALGAATPAGVAQSIDQARDAKAKAEAELAALTGGVPAQAAPAAPIEAAPELPAVPVNVSAPSAPVEAAVPPVPTPQETAISEPAREQAPPAPVSVVPSTAEPTPTAAPAPRLVMDEGNDLLLPTDKPEIIVGREDPISGIFPEIDLTPYGGETGGVSRQHARLNYNAGQWTVTDLNSTNYTRVDGAKIEPNVATALKDGVRLQFGRVAMTFKS